MAIYVTIERVARADQRILVDVLYRSDDGQLKQPRVLEFDADVTEQVVRETIVKLGFEFHKAEDTISKNLSGLVGLTYDVVTGEQAEPKEFDLGGRIETDSEPAAPPSRG